MSFPSDISPDTVREALRTLGAIGSGQAATRADVTREVCRITGRNVIARTVRDLAHDTRIPETLADHPFKAILFNSKGLYLPSRRSPAATAQDFKDCAGLMKALVSDMPGQASALEQVAESILNPTPGLFDNVEEDAA